MTRTQIQLLDKAVEGIQAYRMHPHCRPIVCLTESRPLHDAPRQKARANDSALRWRYDVRSALTMTSQGVNELATVNLKDFAGLGFRNLWNPIATA